MLSDLGHKDMGVFDEVVEGTNLLGQVPLTGLYPQTFKPAKLHPRKSSRTLLPPGQPFLGLCVPRVMLTPRL